MIIESRLTISKKTKAFLKMPGRREIEIIELIEQLISLTGSGIWMI